MRFILYMQVAHVSASRADTCFDWPRADDDITQRECKPLYYLLVVDPPHFLWLVKKTLGINLSKITFVRFACTHLRRVFLFS